jgi:hypothetical protein
MHLYFFSTADYRQFNLSLKRLRDFAIAVECRICFNLTPILLATLRDVQYYFYLSLSSDERSPIVLISDVMEPVKLSETSPLASPRREQRRSAMKKSISTKPQIQVNVKWDISLSPRSPITERSTPRLEYSPAFQRRISSGSIGGRFSGSSVAEEVGALECGQ